MSDLPKDLKYAATHEWAKREGSVVRVGITDFAQQELGDLVYVELPEVGRRVKAKEQCAVVESVKTASDLYSPVEGEIVEVNASLSDSPEQINDAPYATWIFCVKTAEAPELSNLMDADAYQAMIEAE
jgi:glycine cleavage system H protein